MKKLLILSLTVVLTISSFAQDQPTVKTEKNVFKVNALPLFLGIGSIFYERKLSDLTAAQLGVLYMSYKFSDTKFTGLAITPEFRIYPKKNALNGVYIGPYLRYQSFTVEDKVSASKGSLTSMGGGLVIGRQWITKSGFTMDLFFGGHYASANVKVDNGTIDEGSIKGFKTRVGFALGFAF